MLDVHAPDHKLNGRRDFFVHLFTITVGLLIALALENAAEALHHYHQRREAEASIRRELEQNREDLKNYVPVMKREIENMSKVLAAVQARSNGDMHDVQGLNILFQEAPIPEAAWRTAASMGALSYMPYDEVQRFAAAYQEQEMLQGMEEKTLEDYLILGPFLITSPGAEVDMSKVTTETATAALPYARQTIGHLSGMYAIGAGTLQAYNEALK